MEGPERELWQRADRLLDELLDLPPGQRNNRLSELAPDDELRRRVQRLLAAHDETSGLLDTPLPAPLAPAALTGQQLGRWRLREEIGRGGMAVVYRAVAEDGAAGLVAALKVLTLGALAHQGRDRFLQEQQVLLRLRHPYVAALYDAGVAADGTTWMAMALVDGEPIDLWCQQHSLDASARVRLALQVCEALSYTHRNLIIHRDIKPSNVLVDRDGHVRVLDFGIARLMDDADHERTSTMLRALTPEYAAPEQFAGAPPSTAMDVFGLGALLYRLLVGAPPRVTGHDNRATPALPPSRALRAASSGHAHPDLRQRVKCLRGDLDTIVMKALAEKPEDRYASIEVLALDLQRWLEGKPIAAHPPSWRYRLGKFVARNRWPVASAALLLLALAGGVAGTSWQASIARQEAAHARAAAAQIVVQRDRAETQAQRAIAVRDFLADVFNSTDPSTGDVPNALDLLNAGSRRAREELLQRDPLTAADVLLISGGARNALNDFDRAEADLELALDLLKRAKPDPARELSRVHWELGLLYKLRGESEKWVAHDRLAVHWVQRWNAPARERLTRELSLAAALATVDPQGEGESMLRALLERIPAEGLSHSQLHLDALNAFTSFLARNQRGLDERIALHEQRIDVARQVYGENNGWYAYTLADAVPTLRKSPAHVDHAEAIGRKALALSESIYDQPHMFVAVAACNLAATLLYSGRLEEALGHYDRSIVIDEALQRGDNHAESCRYGRAKVRSGLGDYRGALADLALDRIMLTKLSKQRSYEWLRNCAAHAEVLRQQDKPRQADALLETCESGHRPEHGEPPPEYLAARAGMSVAKEAAPR